MNGCRVLTPSATQYTNKMKHAGDARTLLRRCRGLCGAGLLLVLLTASPANAQEFRASITGLVTDRSGAVIPGATVTAINNGTDQKYSTKTDGEGNYVLLYLLPAHYTVSTSAPGFETKVVQNVILESAQQRGLNVTLSPGTVTQQVVVKATGQLLETVNASIGGVIDQTKVEEMPSTGRQVWDDVSLTPGIRTTATDPFDLTLRNNGNKYTVSGVPNDANAFFMNGAPVSDQGSWYFAPEQDAVQEVQASASPYDAQYGRTAGGAFNANVKSGSDQFHGSVYDYYGNEALNANYYANDLFHIPLGINIRNTFGATVGGPIIHHKTFFFFGYEGFRQNYPAPAVDSVPPMAWRSGNFQGSGYTIYDPATTKCAKNTTSGCSLYTRTPFPNNTIPTNRISPIAQAILAMYPQPTADGIVSNYAIRGARNFSYDQYVGRVDHTFTPNTRIYALYTAQKNGANYPGNGFTNVASTATTPTGFAYTIIADVTHIFSNTLVLDLKASLVHTTNETITGQTIQKNFLASSLDFNMPAIGSTSHQNLAPQIGASNYSGLFGNTDNGHADADADFGGSLVQTIGRHTLHYGAEAMDVQSATVGIPGTPNGSFGFNAGFTQQNPFKSNPTQGNSIASLLLGVPSGGDITWDSNTFITYHYYGLFVQDTFKLRPNLSITGGLRWDVNESPQERHNRMNGNFCLTCTNPLSQQVNFGSAPLLQGPLTGGWTFAGVNGVSSAPYKAQLNDWQPRVGVSWALTPLTVIRGGYGIFYSWPYINTTSNGFSQTTPFISSLDGGLTPSNYLTTGTPYPNGAISPTGASAGLETNAGQGITFYNIDRVQRKAQHYSFGVQREFPHGVLLDVEYIGARSSGLPVNNQIGIITTALQQSCFQDIALCQTNVSNPFYGVVPANTPLGASSKIQVWELQRAYPLFNGIDENQLPTGTSHYNSGNIRVERQTRSLDFIFNYAYSNWVDRFEYLNNGAFRDANLWSGPDASDSRHSINANVVYPLPTTAKKGVLGAILNNWLVDSTIMWRTGAPLGIPSANLTGAQGCTSYFPAGGQSRGHWFNNDVSCYQPLVSWQARTTPLRVGYLRNPNLFFWNPAFHKQFALPREGTSVRFRLEAVNGANHPTFGGPNEALSQKPSFSPTNGYTGFGSLPLNQSNAPRAVIASLRISF